MQPAKGLVLDIRSGTACGKEATIDAALYQNATTYGFGITNASVSGDCLTVTIAASGCDGHTWEADLLDAGAIAKSLPPQRSLSISLKNNELCTAEPGRIFSFDFYPLRVGGTRKVILHLDGYNKFLEYSY